MVSEPLAPDPEDAPPIVAERCPSCLRPNRDARDACEACGMPLRWASPDAYRVFLVEMKRRAVTVLLFGAFEAFVGLVLLSVLVLVLVHMIQNRMWWPLGLWIFSGACLAIDGLRRLLHARRRLLY